MKNIKEITKTQKTFTSISSLGVLLFMASCGQNSHMTLDAVTTPADSTAPTASLSGGPGGAINTALQAITVTFSEALLGTSLSSADFSITNGVFKQFKLFAKFSSAHIVHL